MARFLAIDWDQNQLHVISAEVNKGSVRVKRAMVWQENRVPNLGLAEELGKFLRDKLKEGGFAPAPVLACVGRDRMIVKDIRFPSVPSSEEPAIVRFQTVKELTDAPEDVVIDYVTSGPPVAGEQKASALVVRKEMIDAYRGICEIAGLKLAAMVPRSIGVATCLRKVMGTTVITPFPTPRDGVIAVINLGEKFAEICILKGESFLLTRSLNAGPLLAGEIRRSLSVHAGQQPHLPVVAVYLTGQGSGELRQQLSDMIEQPVYVFDPFAWAESIEFADDPPAKPKTGKITINVLQETDAPRPNVASRGTFAGAMGLLFQKSASAELPVNFVSPRQPKPPSNPNYRLIRLAAVAGAVLFVGLIVLGQVLVATAQSELDALKADLGTLEKQLEDTKTNADRLKKINQWDNAVWLDEMYDLAARIPDVNTLRITEFDAEPIMRNNRDKSKNKALEKTIAKVTIKGKLLNRQNPREALNKLVSAFIDDGYLVDPPPDVKNEDTFTLWVHVQRRSPDDFNHLIKLDKGAVSNSTTSKSGEAADDEEMPKRGVGKAGAEKGKAMNGKGDRRSGKERSRGGRGKAKANEDWDE